MIDTVNLYSGADDVILFADSEELARKSGARLIEVDADHRLTDPNRWWRCRGRMRTQLDKMLHYRTLLADGADALRSVQTQVVTPALERLVEANTLLSGIGFESSGLAAAHAIHNGLTTAKATHDYLHGEKVAFGLLTQLVLEGQPRSVLHRVLGFATEVGLPIALADIGLTELPKEVLTKIAVRATAENDTMHNEPFEVSPDMVADAIMAADAMGRAWKTDHCSQSENGLKLFAR